MKKILVIDDQPEIVNLISNFLENRYEVYPAKTTAIAVSRLNTIKFDLILLDILMPGISGIEFFEYIQTQNWYDKVPVIFVTSESEFKIVLKAVKLGAAGYIKKPIEKKALLEKIKSVIGE
ncbi:MAG: response regulator [Spirochaetaceae bacterium]|nr:response regulator [Spirochaetaceae bacterium]